MNSGYIGFSRSVRSQQARREGKMTATDFAKWVRRFRSFRGCTAADVAACLAACEWHHTSKRFNTTNYYDPRDLLVQTNRRRLAGRIAIRKRGKNGLLTDQFTAEATALGLTITRPSADSKLIHAVDGNGIVQGWCQIADDKLWNRKAGIYWN